jgi:hypothetical protein
VTVASMGSWPSTDTAKFVTHLQQGKHARESEGERERW